MSASRYASLLRDVQRLAHAADTALATQKVVAYWELGARIQQERIVERSGYHNSVIRDLARDASLGMRNLQYAVAFRLDFPRCPKDSLTWAHYRLLLDLPDANQRKHYRRLALEESLPTGKLRHLIQHDRRAQTPSETPVPRPDKPSYLYAATLTNVVDGDTVDLRIDLGFHSDHRGRFRLADIDCPESDTPQGRAARDFVYAKLLAAKTIVVKTQRTDIHGRYVAHLFYSDTDIPIDTCFTEGTHLNNELVITQHADLMLM